MGFLGLLASPAVAMRNGGWAQTQKQCVGLSVKLYEYKTIQVNDTSFEVRIRDENGQYFPIKLSCRNKDLSIKKCHRNQHLNIFDNCSEAHMKVAMPAKNSSLLVLSSLVSEASFNQKEGLRELSPHPRYAQRAQLRHTAHRM